MTEIKYTRWGLAERVDDIIYLNKNLSYKIYAGLRVRLIKDLEGKQNISVFGDKELMGFALSNPSSLLQLLPVSIRGGHICISWWQVLSDAITLGLIIGVIMLIKH